MALVTCKECGHQVSDRAAACPSCGAPIAPVVFTPSPARLWGPWSAWSWLAWTLGALGVVGACGIWALETFVPDHPPQHVLVTEAKLCTRR